MKLGNYFDLLKATFAEWSEDKVPRLAAALSYYTIFSLVPLLVLLIILVGVIYGQEAVRNQLSGQIQGVVGPQAADFIQSTIANMHTTGGGVVTTVVSFVVLVFAATNLFYQLHEALNTIWEVADAPGAGIKETVINRALAFVMVLGVGALILLSLVLDTILANINQFAGNLLPGAGWVWQVLNQLVAFGIITLLFAMIYKYLPSAKIDWEDVWIGSVITALLFVIGKWALGFYLARAGSVSAYGAAGSMVALLLWVYYSAQIIFFGAEFTQVYARRYGKRIVPEEGAIHLTEAARAEEGTPHKEALEKVEKETQPVRTVPAVQFMEPKREETILPPAEPSMLAVSAIFAMLVGFVGGWALKRGGSKR